MIEKKLFGETGGKQVYEYILDNGKGVSASIINYGGIVKDLCYKGVDAVLGRDSLEEYLDNNGSYGALIGRNANRIGGASFELGGTVYKVEENKPSANLHSGSACFGLKVLDSEIVGDSVVMSCFSPDGEGGFPGGLTAKVTYSLTDENGLKIVYEAESDKDTVVNMTNHSYFNLNGHDNGNIDDHEVWINAGFFTPMNEYSVPSGEVLSVKGTPFDFTEPKPIARDWLECKQITDYGGYDHNFVLRGKGFRKIATAKGDKTNITLEVYTDLPGVQFYTGNQIEEGRVCKGGAVYSKHSAFCFETQYFPDAPNEPHFPSSTLRAGEKYYTVTEFRLKG